MSTGPYEIKFEVDDVTSLDDARMLAAQEHLDAFVVLTAHGAVLTIEADGDNGLLAAQSAVTRLNNLGITPVRSVPDVVDVAAIAERAGVTRQAADNWTRGARESGFPAPYWIGGPRIWLWREVNDWLRLHGKMFDADVQYPSRGNHTLLDAALLKASPAVAEPGAILSG